MHNDSDNSAVLLDLIKILLDLFLAQIIAPLGGSLGEGLLFRLGPALRKLDKNNPRPVIVKTSGLEARVTALNS